MEKISHDWSIQFNFAVSSASWVPQKSHHLSITLIQKFSSMHYLVISLTVRPKRRESNTIKFATVLSRQSSNREINCLRIRVCSNWMHCQAVSSVLAGLISTNGRMHDYPLWIAVSIWAATRQVHWNRSHCIIELNAPKQCIKYLIFPLSHLPIRWSWMSTWRTMRNFRYPSMKCMSLHHKSPKCLDCSRWMSVSWILNLFASSQVTRQPINKSMLSQSAYGRTTREHEIDLFHQSLLSNTFNS